VKQAIAEREEREQKAAAEKAKRRVNPEKSIFSDFRNKDLIYRMLMKIQENEKNVKEQLSWQQISRQHKSSLPPQK
jgi:hypothetical protein